MDSIPYWRNIYKTLSGKSVCLSALPNYVENIIKSVEGELTLGLQCFTKYTDEGYEKFKKKFVIEKDDRNIELFIKKISRMLDLDASVTYSLFCNYLMFDYFGNLDELSQIDFKSDNQLLNKMWDFYTLERMFLLRTLRCIIENFENKDHIYQKHFNKWVQQQTGKKLITALLTQYKALLYEINMHNKNNCASIKDWVDRNNAEQLELLMIMLFLAYKVKMEIDDFVLLMTLFNDHGFGLKPPQYYESAAISNAKDLKDIIHMEYALFLVALRNYWNDNTLGSSENFEKLFKELSQMTSEHSVILLSTCMLMINFPNDVKKNYEEFLSTSYNQGFNNNVFTILLSVCSKQYVTGTINKIVKEAVWQLFSLVAKKIDDKWLMYDKTGCVELLVCLLELPHLAERAMNPEEPLHLLLSLEMNIFPYNYQVFTIMCTTLIKQKVFIEQIMKLLMNFASYTDEAPENINNTPYITIYEPQEVMKGIIIPAECKGLITPAGKRTLLHFQGPIHYTYFDVLVNYTKDLVDNIENQRQGTADLTESSFNAVIGMNLLVAMIPHKKNLWMEPKVKQIVNQCIYVLSKSDQHKCEDMKLITASFQVISTMMSTHRCNLANNLLTSYSLPSIPMSHFTVEKLFKSNFVNESSLVQFVMKEHSMGGYSLLLSYLDFANDCLINEYDHQRLTIPSLVFIIVYIFPQHLNWEYKVVHDKCMISQKVLNYIFSILQMDKIENETIKLAYDFCYEALFNYDAFIKAFLALVRVSNSEVERVITKEVDWENGLVNELISNIRTSMSIILWMFNKMEYSAFKQTRFWKYFFYTGSNFPSIIRLTCEYINHKFDPILPKLACKLLRRMSNDASMPVLACLEMDSYQIQWMFLDRLRDPLVDDEMKMALLEIITTCVRKQNGMTAAFFNLTPSKNNKNRSKNREETLISYMNDYLKNVAKSPEYLKSPVQTSLLELFQTIFAEKKTSLIKDLISKSMFWKTIILPLTKKYKLSDTIYTQVIDIIATEVYNRDIDVKLKEQLKMVVFSAEVRTAEYLSRYISDNVYANPKSKTAITLLYTWKKFLVFCIRNHDHLIDTRTKEALTMSTLKGFLRHVEDPQDIRIIVNFSDLYLYLITKWGNDAYGDDEILKILALTYTHLEKIYVHLNNKTKGNIWTILIKTVEHFDETFHESSEVIKGLLQVIGAIIEKEFECLLLNKLKPLIDDSIFEPWLLIVIFGKALVKHRVYAKWFCFTQFMDKIISTIGYFMSQAETLSIAKISSQFLVDYLDSSLFQEFISVKYTQFYDSIKPPAHLLDYELSTIENGNANNFCEFWLAYGSIINFNLKLVCRFEHFMFEPLLEFLAMHRTEIFKIIKLPEVTVDLSALKLVSNTLRLINHLLRWKQKWRALDAPLFVSYYEAVSQCFNSCVFIIVRPEIIKTYTIDENFKLTPVHTERLHFFSAVMNGIVEILGSSALALSHMSPNLVDLLGQSNFDFSYLVVFEYSFHIPNPDNMDGPAKHLSYGAVLCLLNYLSKALLQIQSSKKDKKGVRRKERFLAVSWEKEDKQPLRFPYITFVNRNYISGTHIDLIGYMPRFATSEQYSLTAPWLNHMDRERVIYTLEILTTLLSSQVFKSLVEYSKNPLQLQVIKRDFCSELQFYHEFVRKKLIDQHKYVFDGNIVLKNKSFVDKSLDSIAENAEYLLCLSHWFLVICQLTP